nr:IS30 family transposase [Xanthomonas axonopodis]
MLQIEISNGASMRSIARRLGRSASTMCRELGRQQEPAYAATLAAQRYRQRRRNSVAGTRWLRAALCSRAFVTTWCYIAGRPSRLLPSMRSMHPDDSAQRVSHETIYASIYAHPRAGLKKELVEALRQSKPTRGRRRTTAAKRSWVPGELRIAHRPEEVQQRLVPGHWEGDLIKGAFNRSCVGTLVERKTRFVILCKMDGCTAEAALEGFSRQLKKFPAAMRSSMTYDRGTEMTCYAALMARLDMDVWFADPHAPWQRGSNENTNGLLRQFLPKGVDLSVASQEYLNHVAWLMNTRPRQTLGWKTPAEVMDVEIQAFKSRVALAS